MNTKKLEEEGADLWRAIMRSTRKIIKSHSASHGESHSSECQENTPKPTTPKPTTTVLPLRRATGEARPVSRPSRPSSALASDLDGEKVSGLDRRLAQRLRRGVIPIEARVDLHGLTRAAAAQLLRAQLPRYYARGTRCLLVITGKGKGLLRENLPMLLTSDGLRGIVLGHCLAQNKDGGGGARYVLLRRRRARRCD